ncbi:serine/threonine-protein kinase [Lentisphaera profundi]|uniref:Serine/threonine-protein kinase n=1 Tax=Lentisphaera profundi TaxID=1658616 RepID=A0ABY7VNB2_9BACT|nr:serine/threonine-protein kinase [Lentisphaera profundi]WDE95221.1 serine/threonine-protein kinase [Lentisphaera profundi]
MSNKAKQSVISALFQSAIQEPQERGKVLLNDLRDLQLEGRYDAGKPLSAGGMKEISVHSDQMIQRQIAMAIPLKDKQDYESLWNFIREARITAKVAHPNIVPVHEIGVNDDDIPFYTMKYIQGEDLGEVLKKLAENNATYQKDYSLNKRLTIYIKICEAIAFAHSQGVIHLDLKPENILVSTYGQVQVCDWGLAHELDHLEETLEAKLTGSPGYLSPEQIKGEDIGVESDVYALGALLYHMLGLVRPFDGVELNDVLKRTLLGTVPALQEISSQKVPRILQAIVKKAMQVDLCERYSSVNELIQDIEAYKHSYPTVAGTPGYWGRFSLFTKRYKTTSMVILFGLVILSIISSIFSVQMQEEIYKRKEVAEKAVDHYNSLAQSNIVNFEFDLAMRNVSLALQSKDNKESHWLKAKIHMARRELKEARPHARQSNEALLAIIDQLGDYKNKESDEFLLVLIEELRKKQLHEIVRDLMWIRNAHYNSLEEHLPLVEAAINILNAGMKHYDLKIHQGKIHFSASAGFSRFGPFMNLPVEKLVLNDSSSYELRGLRGMKQLRHLELKNTQVFEVPELRGMTLDYLDLSNTNIYSFKDLVHVKVKHLVFKGGKALYLKEMLDNTFLEKLEIDTWRYLQAFDQRSIEKLKDKGILARTESEGNQ